MQNKNSCFFIEKRPFYIRLLVVILAIILCFNCTFKPKKVDAAVVAGMTISELVAVFGTLTGVAVSTGGFLLELYKTFYADDTATEDDMVDYFNQQITIDGDGNYIVSDDGMVTINGMKEVAESEMTYIDAYAFTSDRISGEAFPTGYAYKGFTSLVKYFPDYAWEIVTDWNINLTVGDNTYKCLLCYALEDVEYGVSSEISTSLPRVNLYNGNWEQCKVRKFFVCLDSERVIYFTSNDNPVIEYVTDAEASIHMSDIPYDTPSNYGYLNGAATLSTPIYEGSANEFAQWYGNSKNMLCSDKQGSIPVFTSVDAMKRGTVNGSCGQFMPNYSPGTVTDNSVTQKEINDYSTTYNYYYGTSGDGGGGSGPGSDDGGGSSGNWLDSLLNGIGSIGNAIMNIISKIIEILGQAIELIVSTITDFTDLVTGGFTDFLTAVFPFLPDEFVKIIGLGLVLAVFGVIIRCFIG